MITDIVSIDNDAAGIAAPNDMINNINAIIKYVHGSIINTSFHPTSNICSEHLFVKLIITLKLKDVKRIF